MSSRTERPRVSVFVQAYNTERYVGEALESVFEQRGDFDLDVIVIDDASTDATPGIIDKVAGGRARIITHATNTGAIATANEGYAAATGEFVMRLDSDDRLRPGYLAHAVEALRSAPRAGFAYADITMIDAAGAVSAEGGAIARHGRPAVGDELLPLLLDNFVPAPTTLVRREALMPLLPVPATYRFLDWHVTAGVAENWQTAYVKTIGADYRVHGENMHRAMIRDRRGEQTSLAILDRLFASPVRAAEKRAWRARVYARHYLVYADKYFGLDMVADARRCYLQAVAKQPSLLLQPGVSRHLAGSVMGRRMYDAAKGVVSAGSTS